MIRDTLTKKEYDALVDDFITQGYDIKSEGETNTLLKKRTYCSAAGLIVSILLALILSWTFIGLFIHVVYAIYAHYTAPEVLVRRPL